MWKPKWIKAKMNDVYCGLGSNVGDKSAFLRKAIEALNCGAVRVEKVSSFYETEPMGDAAENYINAVIKVSTEMPLCEFLNFVKETEKKIGRRETYRWGPREIDIDILLFGNTVYSGERLTVPHPGIVYRDFVLTPLFEIAGDIELPGTGKRLSEFMDKLQNHYILRRI